jgi:hypothetical protein
MNIILIATIIMFENNLKQQLDDVSDRVNLYRRELEENNVCNKDIHDLIELCIESNYHEIHNMLSTTNYSEYNQWVKQNINKNNSFSRWLMKVKQDEDEEHLRRYQKIMKRI